MKKYLYIIITAFMLVTIAVVFLMSRRSPAEIQISDRVSVIKEIRSLQRLETAVFTVEKVIDAGSAGNSFQEILFGDRILLIANGDVIAGIDLSDLQEQDISITGKSILLTLPPPSILVSRIDNEKTRVYDRRLGLLTKGDRNLEADARKAAEIQIRQAACDGGILREAAQNAQKQLTVLLKALGFLQVTVSVPPGQC